MGCVRAVVQRLRVRVRGRGRGRGRVRGRGWGACVQSCSALGLG